MRHDPSDPDWTGPRPVRPLRGPLQPDPLHPALPRRLRPGAGRPGGVPHLGQQDPRPPRARPHGGRRDDDRAAGPGRRQRRRHGDGRALRARPVRPRRRRGRVPVRPHHLGVRLRRRPAGGRLRRGVLARGPPEAGQPGRAVGRQPHLHRGRHRDRLLRGHRQAVRGVRLARAARRPAARRRPRPRGALYEAFEAARAETGRPSFIAVRSIIAWPAPNAQNTGAAHGSALGEEEVAATKKVLGFDPDKHFEVDDRGPGARPQGVASAAARRAPPGTSGSPSGVRPTRSAPPSSTGSAQATCPTAGRRRCPSSRPASPWPPARRPARCSRRSAR